MQEQTSYLMPLKLALNKTGQIKSFSLKANCFTVLQHNIQSHYLSKGLYN